MNDKFRRKRTAAKFLPVLFMLSVTSSGCSSTGGQQQSAQQVSANIPSAAQQVQIIQSIQDNPQIPDSAKASAIASFKDRVASMENGSDQSASGASGGPNALSPSQQAEIIQSIKNNPQIPDSGKAAAIASFHQRMQGM